MLKVSEHVVASEFGKGVSILHLKNNRYFRLEGVAWLVWRRMAEPCAITDIVDLLQSVYGIDRNQAAFDVDALLGDLIKNELLRAE